MVNLTVAVSDRQGHPLPGLQPGDFEVREGSVRQDLASAGSEEVPFNLAILLDLSGSTMEQRGAMKEAARRFIGVSRPHDRVALYALANSVFYVVNRLTSERGSLLERIDAIPPVGGLTPLYDSIVLASAEELVQRPRERNALIVISDGIDSGLDKYSTPGSVVRLGDLRKAAEGLPVLIYPVLVGSAERPLFASQARSNMRQLALASGGQIFEAKSLEDLEPVYAQVAEELRSVYSLAYYPKNQNFDGQWRRVEVRVNRAGVSVRTRAGYFAR